MGTSKLLVLIGVLGTWIGVSEGTGEVPRPHQEVLTIFNVTVPYYTIRAINQQMTKFTQLVIGIPGKETTAKDFTQAVHAATSGCEDKVKVIVPDLGKTPYNEPHNILPGFYPLTLSMILDGFIKSFSSEKILVMGFSKGGQAVQRYSLVYGTGVTNEMRFVLGCASSWTFLEKSMPWQYGLANLPSGFSADQMIKKAQKNTYLLACGAEDTGSADPDANIQGSGRLERAKNLIKSFEQNQVNVQGLIEVPNVAHDYSKVIPSANKFVCDL